MAKGIGRQFQLGIAKEAVRGTAETTATYWVPFSQANVSEKIESVKQEESRGVIEGQTAQSIVRKLTEVSATAPIGDKFFPLLLRSALGTLSSATKAGETLVYEHTITAAQSIQPQSLTLFLDDPLAAVDYKHPLGCVDSLEIKYELGKLVEFTTAMMAKKGASGALTPAASTDNIFTSKHVSFKMAANLAGLGAASASSIMSMNLKIERSLERYDILGTDEPTDFHAQELKISGELEAIWDTEAEYKTAFLANTAKAMRIDLVNNDVTIGSTSNPGLQIDLAKVHFSELDRPIELGKAISQKLKFEAFYSISDSKMITIKATNLVATY